jgi:hypothetical protein
MFRRRPSNRAVAMYRRALVARERSAASLPSSTQTSFRLAPAQREQRLIMARAL